MFDIIDVFTREIVGHHEGLRCRTKEALKALDEVVKLGNCLQSLRKNTF